MHASYPTAVRAHGEERSSASGDHTHGVDLESASSALNEIIGRSAVARRALGPDYSKPPVRYYMLAHAFRDPIALQVASRQVCDLKLPQPTVEKMNVSAKFMAMPFRSEAAAQQPAGASE